MNRLKRLALGGAAAALIMTGATSQSFAVEPADGTNAAPTGGASIGLPLGAAPPPGLYTGLETTFSAGTLSHQGNQSIGPPSLPGKLQDAFEGVAAVPLIWSTGWNIFGGSLVLDAVEVFYDIGLTSTGAGGPANPSLNFPTVANTTWGGSLSWNLGQGLFFAAGFAFEGPDGSHYALTSNGGSLNPDYWSFEPTAAISYLSNNWLLSANMAYFFNTASKGTSAAVPGFPAPFNAAANGYRSGEEFYLDLTALYKIGKWEIGPVGNIVWQTTSDSPGGGLTCATATFPGPPGSPSICGRDEFVALGGLIGYDFGLVDLQVWVTDPVHCQDTPACGWTVSTRLGFRLWGPEAPAAKPLVAKN